MNIYKKNNMKKTLCFLISIVFVIITITYISKLNNSTFNHSTFNGSVSKNDNKFIMEFDILNKTDSHSFELKEGDTISVSVEKNKGELSVSIGEYSEVPIYRSDNLTTSTFKVIATKNGTYQVKVTVNTLVSLNNIQNPNLIYIGQRIKIPRNTNSSCQSYTVKYRRYTNIYC